MQPSILIVDDEPSLRGALEAFLVDEGFQVRTASDGDEALRIQTSTPSDLILSDVTMPKLDGTGLVGRLRERGDRTEVVLMSAANSPATNQFNVHWMAKPFDLDALNQLLRTLVARTLGVQPLPGPETAASAGEGIADQPASLDAFATRQIVERLRRQRDRCRVQIERGRGTAALAACLLSKFGVAANNQEDSPRRHTNGAGFAQ